MAAVARPRPARLPARRPRSGPTHRKRFDVEVLVGGEPVGAGRRAEQEGSGAGRREAGAGHAQALTDRRIQLVFRTDFPTSQSISMIPQASRGRRRRRAGERERRLGLRQPRRARRRALRARRRRRSAASAGSAAGPRGAAADRRSCSASAARRSGRRPRATTGSPWSSPGVRRRRCAISVSVSGSSSASTSRMALSAP